MKLINYYYDDINRYLLIEFSLKEDGEDFYRTLELTYSDIEYYSPDIITESDLENLNRCFIKDLIKEYLKENEPPEQLIF